LEEKMMLRGRVWRFGRDVDTDQLFPGRYIMGGEEDEEKKYEAYIRKRGLEVSHENIPPEFKEKVREGDIIVAEENFGVGSSRQQAAQALKALGIRAVVADSIHRIFFRNFWNLGCPAIDVRGISSKFRTGDEIEIDLKRRKIRNLSTSSEFHYNLISPNWFIEMVDRGGLIPYYKHLQSN
jgi:3-isopropylmalate/(R)-2-methylmalate dehydratase small subunit